MGFVRMVPYTESDIVENSLGQVTDAESFIRSSNIIKPTGALGSVSFGLNSFRDKQSRKFMEDHLRSYIKLSGRVVNTAILRGTSNILTKILNMDSRLMKDIIECTKVWDIANQEYISRNDCQPGNNYSFGGEIINSLITSWRREESVCDLLTKLLCSKAYTDTEYIKYKQFEGQSPIWVEYTPNSGNILNDYTAYMLPSCPAKRRNMTLDSLIEWFLEDYMVNNIDNPIVSCIRTNNGRLKTLTTQTVRVIPVGLRPNIDRMDDPITLNYNDLIRASTALESVDRFRDPTTYAYKYASLQRFYDLFASVAQPKRLELAKMYKDSKLETRKSIADTIARKTGHIRGKMLSKVQDSSCRSVIIANPEISVTEVSVPKKSVNKIMEYHLQVKDGGCNNMAEACEQVPVSLNRAPTLHKLSWRGFNLVPTYSNAVGTHPLVNEGYNADYDGDQMGVHVPMSSEAIREVYALMGLQNNLYVPASGNVTVKPKQDMLYGLNIITGNYIIPEGYSPVTDYCEDIEELVQKVEYQDLAVWDYCSVGGQSLTVAEHLVHYCFPQRLWLKCINITKDNLEGIMQELVGAVYKDSSRPEMSTSDILVEYLDRITKISFLIATLYPPTLNIFVPYQEELHEPFKKFLEQDVYKLQEGIIYGLDSQASYNRKYTEEYEKIAKGVSANLKNMIGEQNGFVRLMTCGARGSMSNLQQIFSYKGRIARSATESFNTVITSSYLSQLSDMEHFIVSHGTRKSLQDKTRKPADTGYASRRMMHVTADAVIRHHDCGTTEGIEISFRRFLRYAETRGNDDTVAESMLASYIKGRFPTEGTTFNLDFNSPISVEKANEIASIMHQQFNEVSENADILVIRSPLTCGSKYCAKCYGINWATHRLPIIGTPIGALAATSLGEPGTQLSMRTFQKGGIASKVDITSDFDKVNAILNCKKSDVTDPYFDPIAWETGKVYSSYDGKYTNICIAGSDREVSFKGKIDVREYCYKGEGLSEVQGNLDIKTIVKEAGILAAQMHVVMSIFNIYFSEVNVSPIHCEVLASESTKYVVTFTDGKAYLPSGETLEVGMVLNQFERTHLKGSELNTKLVPQYYNTGSAPLLGENFLSGLSYMEFKLNMESALCFEKTDSMESAFSNIMMGLSPKVGTRFNPTYIQDVLFQLNTEEAQV